MLRKKYYYLAIDRMFPTVYNVANTGNPLIGFMNNANEPKSDSNIPTTKHMANPLILVDQLSDDISLICKMKIHFFFCD